MKIRTIELSETTSQPVAVTVTMTVSEALYIGTLLGKQNDAAANEVMPDGVPLGSEIYSALTGDLFNRFWEDGLDGARRNLDVW